MPDKLFKTSRYGEIFWFKAPYAVAQVDDRGKIFDCNHSFCNLMGFDKDELSTITFDILTHPDDLIADRSFFTDLLEKKITSYEMKKRYITKSGIMFLAHLHVFGIYEDDGKFSHCVSMILPISLYGSNFWSFVAKDWIRARKVIWGVFFILITILMQKLFNIDISSLLR
jgi:PAS domain S-box-containing protein